MPAAFFGAWWCVTTYLLSSLRRCSDGVVVEEVAEESVVYLRNFRALGADAVASLAEVNHVAVNDLLLDHMLNKSQRGLDTFSTGGKRLTWLLFIDQVYQNVKTSSNTKTAYILKVQSAGYSECERPLKITQTHSGKITACQYARELRVSLYLQASSFLWTILHRGLKTVRDASSIGDRSKANMHNEEQQKSLKIHTANFRAGKETKRKKNEWQLLNDMTD